MPQQAAGQRGGEQHVRRLQRDGAPDGSHGHREERQLNVEGGAAAIALRNHTQIALQRRPFLLPTLRVN